MTAPIRECLVLFQTTQGAQLRGSLLRLNRYEAVFEIYNPQAVLHLSESLSEFTVLAQERPLYRGPAVLANIVNTGTLLLCEVRLDETRFTASSFSPAEANGEPYGGFKAFLSQWQQIYKIRPEFKIVVADMQSFLMDLRLWLEQVELEIRSAPSGSRLELEQRAVRDIGESVVPGFDALHERLEAVSEEIEPELRPVHQNFSKRQLHPLLLCSPFAYRTYNKPLGYAGDYEMVNMLTRSPYEGGSLFAKVVNVWFLSQWPARAHRNRIQYLKKCLVEESLLAARRGRPLRVLDLGCGPAREVQEFLAESPLSDQVHFTLLDFNDETLQHTSRVLEEIRTRMGRASRIQLQRKSVHSVLKDGMRPSVQGADKLYDLIYCAGLFDYLPDRTCKQLMNVFYTQLAPGGLLSTTNVDDCKPFRHMLEFVLDWHLIYRNTGKLSNLLPADAPAEACRIFRDATNVNLLLEVRKPDG